MPKEGGERERRKKRGQMGGETNGAEERVGDRKTERECEQWAECEAHGHRVRGLSFCLDYNWGRKSSGYSSSSSSCSSCSTFPSSLLYFPPFTASDLRLEGLFENLTSCSSFTSLSPASPSGCRVRRLSSTKRGCRPWRWVFETLTCHVILLSFALFRWPPVCLFYRLSVKTEGTPGLLDIAGSFSVSPQSSCGPFSFCFCH